MIGLDKETRIAVGSAAGFLTVQINLAVLVDAFEFECDALLPPLGWRRKGLFIHIHTAWEKANGTAASAFGIAPFVDHGIVGEIDELCCSFLSVLVESPAFIEILFFHTLSFIVQRDYLRYFRAPVCSEQVDIYNEIAIINCNIVSKLIQYVTI